jgi:hypothetical protein
MAVLASVYEMTYAGGSAGTVEYQMILETLDILKNPWH